MIVTFLVSVFTVRIVALYYSGFKQARMYFQLRKERKRVPDKNLIQRMRNYRGRESDQADGGIKTNEGDGDKAGRDSVEGD
ncbi:hypothetical protein [Bartonella taylorii]|uniref:hypothetical protein n=1 Tax=Bartonella taylorii TaxID=33046 RepID=UPI001ABAE2B4|nr:hypothetical protein [Bartonella taylorii]